MALSSVSISLQEIAQVGEESIKNLLFSALHAGEQDAYVIQDINYLAG